MADLLSEASFAVSSILRVVSLMKRLLYSQTWYACLCITLWKPEGMLVQDNFCKISIYIAQKLRCLKLTDLAKNLLLKLFTVRDLYCSHAGHVQIALFFTVLTFCISNALLNLVWHHWSPPGCFGACLPVRYCQYNKGDIFSRHKRSSHMIYCMHITQAVLRAHCSYPPNLQKPVWL